MKKTLIVIMAALLSSCSFAQDKIKLPEPDKNVKMTLTESLQKRQSVRNFGTKPVTDAVLSQVLWAACGINRPDKEMITAPSAVNAQDILVYVCRQDGTFLYNAKENTLVRVTEKDIRPAVAIRDKNVIDAPVFLLLVSDLTRLGGNTEFAKAMAPIDAGYVSQNICLITTALGLNTVPRMMMEYETLKKELSLSDLQIPLLNHPIGYSK